MGKARSSWDQQGAASSEPGAIRRPEQSAEVTSGKEQPGRSSQEALVVVAVVVAAGVSSN